MLMPVRNGNPVAVGMAGFEGFLGVAALQGAAQWRYQVVSRAGGATALRIAIDRLLAACRQSYTLMDLLLCYSGCFSLQVSRAAATNLVEPLERRMARWILLYHDRLPGDEIAMTHQEISIMLGVRRASTTDVLHVLEGQRAIRSERGRVIVRDRPLLEQIAGETYGEAEAEYRRLIGPFNKPTH